MDDTAAGADTAAPTAAEQIDALIAKHPDWRGARLAQLRAIIRSVDPAIVETWKWMGSPVWELGGIICVGNIFEGKVKIGFMDGAALPDPKGIFNAELEGNKRRSIDYFESDVVDEEGLRDLVRAAITLIADRTSAKAAAKASAKKK
ncbi:MULTISPECIES: DUF1801 domain-containing protein [unclassified Frondihabitans]|uniref:DUF1801 domain-containing protein n=1 Tax=unclassified Frondihabitans TaxID=2626248 RepID=UPI000F4E3CFC|nr:MULTISPECIES: DUF1801 domain-containing protein [unclassified Frondihabitans]